MPIPTPFHPRTSELCTSMRWKDWAGYHAVSSFDIYLEREYFAFRHAAGLIDVTPLYKYDFKGPDAGPFLSRMMVRNVQKMRVGRVLYTCWCDDHGKIMDDGTVSRMARDHFRVTSVMPMYWWFTRYMRGYDVTIEEVTHKIAALSLQGPTSRGILKACSDAPMDTLKFFGLTRAKLDNVDVVISRTGYTGDLGYEIWVDNDDALTVWDALMDAGRDYGMLPAGLDAMDITRIEAGFILNGVDYYSAHTCLIEARKSSPYEVNLGWAVKLDREHFNGRPALLREKEEGSTWATIGLEIDWDEFEALFRAHGLPPEVPVHAWRDAVPVYVRRQDARVPKPVKQIMPLKQVGQAMSGAWSPTLKKNLAIACVKSPYAKLGSRLQIEVTVEFVRHTVTATVVEMPFFDPERKKA